MKKKLVLIVLAVIAVSVMAGGATSALFTAQGPIGQSNFRAATVGLNTTGTLDFDAQTANLAPGESPDAHVDTVLVDLSPSTIATKLYVTFTIDGDMPGPYGDSLAEALVIDGLLYGDSGADVIAPGSTFDDLVDDGIRTKTYFLGEVPAGGPSDPSTRTLVFKWHFPNGPDDNRYQGASFRLNYFFTAVQAH